MIDDPITATLAQIDRRLAHSRRASLWSGACVVVAVLAVAAVLVLAVHRGLWPPPDRSPAAQTGQPG